MSRTSRSHSSKSGPLLLIGAGVLLLAVAGALLFALPQNRAPATPLPQLVEETFPEILRVSLADARAAYDSGAAAFVDVRDGDSYTASHIPGALSIPLTELENRLGELNRSDWIITYCT